MVFPKDKAAEWAERLDDRLGLGHFTDTEGMIPRLVGRLQYLAAMALECQSPLDDQTPLEELIDIWSPCMWAMLTLDQEMKARLDTEGTTAAPLPEGVRVILAPIEELLGIRLSVLLQTLRIGPVNRSLPTDSPAMSAAHISLASAFHHHAEWMERWRLPADDVGWCLVTTGMGALWGLESVAMNREEPRTFKTLPDETAQSASPHHELPALVLFDPKRMDDALATMLGAIEHLLQEGLPKAIGQFVAEVIAKTRSATEVVTIPPLSWNPMLDSRSKARARLVAEAENAITEQLDATIDRLTAAGTKRTSSKASGLEQFQWLVRNQIKGKTKQVIAEADGRSVEAVHKALLATRKLIGLSRPRGRPSSSGQ